MRLLLLLTVMLIMLFSIVNAQIMDNINYQGLLTDTTGNPVPDGSHTVKFTIYDGNGMGISWTETQIVTTTDGLFAVLLGDNYPITEDVFDVAMPFLGIQIDADPEMSPLTLLLPVPYAFRIATIDGAKGGVITSKVTIGSSNTNAGSNAFVAGQFNNVSGGGAVISGGSFSAASANFTSIGGGSFNSATALGATVGGGTSGRARGEYSVVAGGGGLDDLDSNSASGEASVISGGRGNVAEGDMATVSGGKGNYSWAEYSTIGGGQSNNANSDGATVAGGVLNGAMEYAVVGGGFSNFAGPYAVVGSGSSNFAQGSYSSILGGSENRTDSSHSTIGGGSSNIAIGHYATIGGGYDNTASGVASTVAGGGTDFQGNFATGHWSSIGGGFNNVTDGSQATVSGGSSNVANGMNSTIAGGRSNLADGDYSFAAGRRAKANHHGSFVWADSTNADFSSSADNQFLIRAGGGVGINTEEPEQTLHVMKGSAGAVTANAGSIAVFESGSTGYLSVLAPDDKSTGVLFGNPQDPQDGSVLYNSSTSPRGLLFRTNGNSTKMTIDSAGHVGIGTTSPIAPLTIKSVDGDGEEVLRFAMERTWAFRQYRAGLSTSLELKSVTSGDTKDFIISTEGDVGIGSAAFIPAYKLDVRGTIGNNATLHHSDRRWKDNIMTLANSLDKVQKLRGVSFDWKRNDFTEMNFPEGKQIGLIAQEVEQVVPELVNTASNGFKSLDYAKLVALLVEANKEQQEQIDELKLLVQQLVANSGEVTQFGQK